MAVRKFLDDSGAALLNTILANKFSGKQDIFISFFTEDLLLVDAALHSLTEGYYYTGNYHIKINGSINSNFDNAIIYVNNIGTIFAFKDGNICYMITYDDLDGEGTYGYQYIRRLLLNEGQIMTSLPTRDASYYDRYVPSARLLRTELLNKYSKPSTGIPKTDLASAVQTSLGKADTALQSETYTGTITGITMNGVSKGTSGVVDLGTVITEHQDISGKQNQVTYSTTDITPGTTTLTTGDIYIVYE